MSGVRIERLGELTPAALERMVEVYMRGYEGLREYGGEGRDYARRYLCWCWKRARDGFFVARVGDAIAGFIVCDCNWYSEEEGRVVGAIHEFVVDMRFQGYGIGRRLIEAGLNYLGRCTDMIELWVGEKNRKAVEFYEGYGFKVVGQKGIWIRMVKDIGECKTRGEGCE